MPSRAKLFLKPGREKSLLRRHPWIFSGAVARVEDEPPAGETIEVRSARGDFLAMAAYSPRSRIVARVWDWAPTPIDAAFFRARVARAVAARAALPETAGTGAVRLVHGESDGLPGVIADRYGDTVVIQLSSAGAERWREAIADALCQAGVARIWERSDVEVRALEGLPPVSGPLRGPGEPTVIEIAEGGLRYRLDLAAGHKTGFYLDQRANRARARRLARDLEVLDCFCYTGGFALNALAGGARTVTAIESSGDALAAARAHARLNGLDDPRWVEGDVFAELRRFRDAALRFDFIVLDPPKLAPTAAHVERAARAYKDVNLLAFKLLRPGGLLMTFSCSGGVSAELFQKIVAGAAVDAGVEAQILERLGPGADHPVALGFPEGDYLKGLLCRVAT